MNWVGKSYHSGVYRRKLKTTTIENIKESQSLLNQPKCLKRTELGAQPIVPALA